MMTYKEPQQAFKDAIGKGRLSDSPRDWNYAGQFMYMGTDEAGIDLFKHSTTRRYLEQ